MDECFQLIGRGVTYRIPCRERVAETGIRPYVLDLLRHSGQDQEDQIVERIERIEVAGPAIGRLQSFLDLANPKFVGRCVCGRCLRHYGVLDGTVPCSRPFASVE